jgi:hypothetical protein
MIRYPIEMPMATGTNAYPSAEVSWSAVWDRSPTTPKKPMSAEFLIMAMMTEPSGTTEAFHDWGSTTYRRF